MTLRCSKSQTFSVLLTYLLTYSMEHSPSWEVNWFSSSQEIVRILWKPKVHHHIHKSTPPVLILSQINSVHVPHLTSWRFILILSSHLNLGLRSCLFASSFPTKTLYAPLLSPIRATCPACLILHKFAVSTQIMFCTQAEMQLSEIKFSCTLG